MGFQTITGESQIRERLKEIDLLKNRLEEEVRSLRSELEKEIKKNKKRRPSRFL